MIIASARKTKCAIVGKGEENGKKVKRGQWSADYGGKCGFWCSFWWKWGV